MNTDYGFFIFFVVSVNSSRNLFILGFSLFFGLVVLQLMFVDCVKSILSYLVLQMMPQWVRENAEAFDTGSEILDQILLVLLETSMFVAGLIGFILDNTVPGNSKGP